MEIPLISDFIKGFKNAFQAQETNETQQTSVFTPQQSQYNATNTIHSGLFNGVGKEAFKQGVECYKNHNSVFKSMSEVGADLMFDYLDLNGDGVITQDESRAIGQLSKDAENDDGTFITENDLKIVKDKIIEDLEQAKFEQDQKAIEAANQATQQAYTQNIGGDNYQAYGEQTASGSTFANEELYNAKRQIETIEQNQIPALESTRSSTISKFNNAITAQQNELEKLNKVYDEKKEIYDNKIKEHEEKIGELKTKKEATQKELEDAEKNIETAEKKIEDAEKKIETADNVISEKKSAMHKSETNIQKLEAEFNSLSTNTGDPEIDKQNAARKAEITNQLKQEKENLENLKKEIENQEKIKQEQGAIKQEQEKIKQEQEKIKASKKEELDKIHDKIKNKLPAELKEELDKIQAELEQIKENQVKIKAEIANLKAEKARTIAEINNQIQVARTQIIDSNAYGTIGNAIGTASSRSGSQVIENAISLLEEYAKKGRIEVNGNNRGPLVDLIRGSGGNAPWCASMMSFVLGRGQGLDNRSTFGVDHSVLGIMNDAKRAGYYRSKSGYMPKRGDLQIQKGGGRSHVRMVVDVVPGKGYWTIGGNESGGVRKKFHSFNSRDYQVYTTGFVDMQGWLGRTA